MSREGQVDIRLGRETDLPQVTDLWRRLVGHHEACDGRIASVAPRGVEKWQRRLESLLADQTFRLFVADAGAADTLVGFATGFLQYAPEVFEPQLTGLVADICVTPRWRRRRVARRLLDALTTWFASEDVDHIELSVVDRNAAGMGFWQSIGAQSFTSRLWLPVDWQQTRRE